MKPDSQTCRVNAKVRAVDSCLPNVDVSGWRVGCSDLLDTEVHDHSLVVRQCTMCAVTTLQVDSRLCEQAVGAGVVDAKPKWHFPSSLQ